jgi:putative ABC transport system permease protein
MNWQERCYRALLLFYPAEFRCAYAAELSQLFRDRIGERSAVLLWLETIADVAVSASREHGLMLIHDLRYAARTMRKSPAFTLAAMFTLALGVGATTAIFSVVNAVMVRPLPFAAPNRLVRVAEKNDKLTFSTFSASVLNYLSWREQAQSFDGMAFFAGAVFNLTGRGDPEQYVAATVTPSLLPVLGLRPVVGRGFAEGEDLPQATPVAMLGEDLWRRRFGTDPKLVGSVLNFNGIGYTIVGIAPASLNVLTGADLCTPCTIDFKNENRMNHVITAVGRLKHGVSIVQAQSEMDTVFTRVARQYPEIKDWGIKLRTFPEWFVSPPLWTALWVLLGAVGFVLLIACANVANLLLSRAASRQKEIAVRTAMGASRGRLARQLLTESAALAVLGGGAGAVAALFSVRLINAALPPNLLPVQPIPVDATLLWFAALVTLATGMIFGLAPAWQAARTDLNTVLKQGGRSSSGAARPALRRALVGGEIALATLLLVGAGLLIQSLGRLERTKVGFRPEKLLCFQVALPQTRYPTAKVWSFYKDFLDSLETLPGVKAAATSSGIPFGVGGSTRTPATAPGSKLPPGTGVPVDWRVVSPSFFRAMEIPLLRGRTFTEADNATAPLTTVVSEETAQRVWGSDDPIGRTLRFANGREFTVVGVVGGVRLGSLDQAPLSGMYISATARPFAAVDVVVRTEGKPESALAGVRARLRALDPELPISNVKTMEEWIDLSAAQPKLNAALLGIFSGVALLIAAIGVYGVLSYAVTQRTREIGLRMAIGAQRGDVIRWILRDGMVVAVAGVVVGLGAAVVLSRLLRTLLFEIDARDPKTFAGVAALLLLVALGACLAPALRASRLDPVTALRQD